MKKRIGLGFLHPRLVKYGVDHFCRFRGWKSCFPCLFCLKRLIERAAYLLSGLLVFCLHKGGWAEFTNSSIA